MKTLCISTGCTVLTLEFDLEKPAILDLLRLHPHARFIPLEAHNDHCSLCDDQISTRISQVSRTPRAPNTIVPRHLVLIPLVTDSLVDRPIVDPQFHFRFIIISKLRA